MQLTAVLTPAEEGGFVALNPETGTTSQGKTVEVAVANLREATILYLAQSPLTFVGHALVTTFSIPEPARVVAGKRCRQPMPIDGKDMPAQSEILLPLLRIIHLNDGEIRPPDAVSRLADEFHLTDEQKQRLRPGKTNTWFYNAVNFARLALVKSGFVSDERYGVWVITAAGREELRSQGLI